MESLQRREVLGIGATIAALPVTGCMGGGDRDQDLVISNEDSAKHSIVVRSDSIGEATADLGPGESTRREDVFPVSDYTYSESLHVEIDGEVTVDREAYLGWSQQPVSVVVSRPNDVRVDSPGYEQTATTTRNGTTLDRRENEERNGTTTPENGN